MPPATDYPSISHVITPVLSFMGTYILRNNVSRIFSKATFEEYRETEKLHNDVPRAVTKDGNLLDYETLELRVHPPNIRIKIEEKGTLITLDSANRPGTLIEVCASSLLASGLPHAMRRGSLWQTTVQPHGSAGCSMSHRAWTAIHQGENYLRWRMVC